MDQSRKPTQADGLAVPGASSPGPAGGPEPFMPLRLVLQPGGATLDVTGPDVLVGRHSEADIRLPLPDVSRRHCRLLFVEGCWQVVDLNSLNGVHVNGEAVLQAPLAEGDLLRIGGFTFAVELGRSPSEAMPAPEGPVHSILQTLVRPHEQPQRRAS